MEQKKSESNIFEPVVLETAAEDESNTVLVLHLVVVVTPVADGDVRGSGLNS